MLSIHHSDSHSTEGAYLLLTQQPRVWYSVFPRNIHLMWLRFIDSTAYNSGQRLVNVNCTHLVLASGKLVLPKSDNPHHRSGSP